MSKTGFEEGNRRLIRFETTPFEIGSRTILRLPVDASAQLPSRGMTLIEGNFNDIPFQAVLEPDGKGSHWFTVDKSLIEDSGMSAGRTVFLAIWPSKDWPEPAVPEDLQSALAATRQAHTLWKSITPMARWDWIRWIRSTRQAETRRRRIEAALDKLGKGERRPCCFNRNLCTDPSVSRNGVLLDPPQ